MTDMLKDILAAEKAARETEKKVQQLKNETISSIQAEKAQIINNRIAEAQAEIERMQLEHKNAVDKSLAANELAAQKAKELLAQSESSCRTQWVNEIYNRVINNK